MFFGRKYCQNHLYQPPDGREYPPHMIFISYSKAGSEQPVNGVYFVGLGPDFFIKV